MNRREALFSIGAAAAGAGVAGHAKAAELRGVPAATAQTADHMPGPIVRGGDFKVFTDQTDHATLKAVFDRLIPSDDHGPSASEAGVLDFLDAQLAGPYGDGAAYYLEGPLQPGHEEEVMGQKQFLETPRQRYAKGLKALEQYAQDNDGASFAALSPDRIDEILTGMEAGKIDLPGGVFGQAFFELMLQNAREGYLSDPIYGGNRDFAGWTMIGFPGARYDYRAYVDRHNEDLALAPVSLIPSN